MTDFTSETEQRLRSLLEQHRRNRLTLLDQEAVYAKGETPLRLLNQISAEEKEIAKLEAEIAALKAVSDEPSAGLSASRSSERSPQAPLPSNPGTAYLTRLRQQIIASFSDGELRTLCFDLGIDYEDLPGQGKADKAHELVAHMQRRGRIPDLAALCAEQRPHSAWREEPRPVPPSGQVETTGEQPRRDKTKIIEPAALPRGPEASLQAGGATTQTQGTENAVEIFYSYSHRDEELRQEIEKHLSILRRQGLISEWHDRRIAAGEEWAAEIDEHLNSAQVILLLISADFLASDYCWGIEMQRAMERHGAGEARVIPIILRPVDWAGAPFAKLQALPKDAKAVTTWPNRDEAFLSVAQGIRAAISQLASR